jgi:hypothetical protein
MRNVFDVKQFGAVGDGVADDQPAVQRAIDAASAAGGGIVHFGRGTFRLLRWRPKEPVGKPWCVKVPSRVVLVGAGPGATILKADADDALDNRVTSWLVHVTGDGVAIRDLALDGSKPTADNTWTLGKEHHPGIFAMSATNLLVSNVRIFHFGGDGIQLHNGTANVMIAHAVISDCDRACVSMTSSVTGKEVNNVRLLDCDLVRAGTQPLDSEPKDDDQTGVNAGSSWNVSITGCRIDKGGAYGDHAITVAGTSRQPARNWRLLGNEIRGTLQIIYAQDTVIEGNTITALPGGEVGVYCYYASESTVLSGNVIRLRNPAATFPMGLRVVAATVDGAPAVASRLLVTNNTFDCAQASADALGVYVDGCGDLTVKGNVFIGPGATAAGGNGIQVRPTVTIRSVVIRDNRFSDFGQFGVRIYGGEAAKGQVLAADISGNTFERTSGGMVTAIKVSDSLPHPVGQLTMSGNVALGGVTTLVDPSAPTVPVLIDGNRDGSAVYGVTGSPEDAVIAPVGAVAHRRDGGAGTTWYVKESGTGATGWVAK